MADFLTAFELTMLTEGGYNPGDGEAETYMGVDRSQNPAWGGWSIIDALKLANPNATVAAFDAICKANTDLQTQVQQFYQVNYWAPMKLDMVNDQLVANGLFDCSVNPCIVSASKAAQIACNTVTHNSVTVDGNIGPITINFINSFQPAIYLTAFNGIRVANYYERVRLTPSDQQWLGSWLWRCKPYL